MCGGSKAALFLSFSSLFFFFLPPTYHSFAFRSSATFSLPLFLPSPHLTSSLPLPLPPSLPSSTFSSTYPATDPPFPRPPLIFRPSRSSLPPLSSLPPPPPHPRPHPRPPPPPPHPPHPHPPHPPPPPPPPHPPPSPLHPPLSSSTLPTVAHEHLTYLISIYPPFLRSPHYLSTRITPHPAIPCHIPNNLLLPTKTKEASPTLNP